MSDANSGQEEPFQWKLEQVDDNIDSLCECAMISAQVDQVANPLVDAAGCKRFARHVALLGEVLPAAWVIHAQEDRVVCLHSKSRRAVAIVGATSYPLTSPLIARFVAGKLVAYLGAGCAGPDQWSPGGGLTAIFSDEDFE